MIKDFRWRLNGKVKVINAILKFLLKVPLEKEFLKKNFWNLIPNKCVFQKKLASCIKKIWITQKESQSPNELREESKESV